MTVDCDAISIYTLDSGKILVEVQNTQTGAVGSMIFKDDKEALTHILDLEKLTLTIIKDCK